MIAMIASSAGPKSFWQIDWTMPFSPNWCATSTIRRGGYALPVSVLHDGIRLPVPGVVIDAGSTISCMRWSFRMPA